MSEPQPPLPDHVLAPWEKAFDRVMTPFEEFIHKETTAGLILVGCTVLALAIANSPLGEPYAHLLHTYMGFSFGQWELKLTLHHWINDGLMWMFFFLVGLEIKREVLLGELAVPKQAILPILAAIGGMVFPALFYFLVNGTGPGVDGWGVPMATDIAFAVSALVLLGTRIPKGLVMFLVALAIVDDLGAVVVIAIFYTDDLSLGALGIAFALFAVLLVFNRLGIRNPLPYFLVGALMWLAMLASGVHATVAGILTAWAIPASSRFDVNHFGQMIQAMGKRFEERSASADRCAMLDDEQQRRGVVQSLLNGVHMIETPLQRLEHSLHIPVAFLVLPVFALANANIPIEFSAIPRLLEEPVTLGIMLGLVLGKLVGIAGVSLLAVRLGIGQLPLGTGPMHIIGVALLGGIGFTMSIFIAELAFAGQQESLILAKTGVLFASLIAGVAGFLWLRFFTQPANHLDAKASPAVAG